LKEDNAVSINKFRSILYKTAKILGDFQAVKSGGSTKMAKCVEEEQQEKQRGVC
jgi:hypothetical protein